MITGKNIINTVVTAQDGTTTQTYTLTVSRAVSSGANLSDLAISDGTLTPVFDNSGKYASFTDNIPWAVNNITITPTVDDSTSTVTVNGAGNYVTSGTSSEPIVLIEGSNTVPIVVTAQNGITNQTYVITVYRALASSVASLNNLTTNVGTIIPLFRSDKYSYTVRVPYDTTSISITPTTTVLDEVITINGNVVTSGTGSAAIPLIVGNNTINVVVTSKDGNTNITYTLNVIRGGPSANAFLDTLVFDKATLTAKIDTNTFSYTATLKNSYKTTDTIVITPFAKQSGATITINGKLTTNKPDSVYIGAGINKIYIQVTAANGDTIKNYTLSVGRLPTLDSLAIISNFTVNGGNDVVLNPHFNSKTNVFTGSLSSDATAIKFTPTYNVVYVKKPLINGVLYDSDVQGAWVPLKAGDNIFPIKVISADAILTNTYNIIISRPPSNIATLSSLTIDSGTLSPTFDPNKENYTVSVRNSTQSLNVIPILTHANAKIIIYNDTTIKSGGVKVIPLTVGTNAIIVTVTAEDGVTQKTYTILVNREKANQTLTFNPPVFDIGEPYDLSTIIPSVKLNII